MEYKVALSKLQVLSGRLYFLLLISLGLLLSNILLVWLTGWSLMHQTRTIVPVNMTAPFSVSNYMVDESYLRQMALFFVAERLDLSPDNVAKTHNLILQYTDPEFYHDFVDILAREQKEVTAQNISSVFYPNEIIPDSHGLRVLVKGTLKRWVGGLGLQPVKKAYLIKFSYKTGVLKIVSFSEVGDNSNA